MKSIIILALLVAFASAFDLRKIEVTQRERFMPVLNNPSPNGRIINGQTAAPNQFPYQVGLSLSHGSGSLWCGGSLISNEWVLTAAHCTIGVVSAIVQLGGNSRLSPLVSFDVYKQDIITHEDYNDDTVWNDIALIRIPYVEYSDAIQNVLLPPFAESYSTFEGYVGVASGWGRTSDASHSVATELQYAYFTVISSAECAETYGTDVIYDGKLCIASTNSVSTCQGDSGGPFVLADYGEQIGIVSFGAEGCKLNRPLAQTRVTSYLPWIVDITGIDIRVDYKNL